MIRGQTQVQAPRTRVLPVPGSLRRWDAPARSGSAPVKRQGWPRPSPGSGTALAGGPRCGTPGRLLPPDPERRPAPEAGGGNGVQPSTWRGAGQRTWGPLGARLWAVSAGLRARPGPGDPRGGCVPPPPHPRLNPARLGPAHLGSAPPPPALCAPGSAWLGSARSDSALHGRSRPGFGSRAARRGGASGSVLIGQGPGVERACPPQPRPRAPGPAET